MSERELRVDGGEIGAAGREGWTRSGVEGARRGSRGREPVVAPVEGGGWLDLRGGGAPSAVVARQPGAATPPSFPAAGPPPLGRETPPIADGGRRTSRGGGEIAAAGGEKRETTLAFSPAEGFGFDDPAVVETVRQAVERARAAQGAWAAVPLVERLRVVRGLRRRLAVRGGELAALVGAGWRGRGEALVGQVLPLADACRFLEEQAGAILAPERPAGRRPAWLGGVDLVVERRPLGVVLVVAPANYPVFLPGVQCLQALAAGNAVVLKPGAAGRGAALWLAARWLEAGLPRDLLAVLGEEPAAAAAALDAGVDHLVLTGSSQTGALLARRAAERLVPSTMELSGCDPLVALPGADPGSVAAALAFALRWNGGATCIAPRRAYLPAETASAVERALVAGLAAEREEGAGDAALPAGSRTGAGERGGRGAAETPVASHAHAAARRAASSAVAAGARLVWGDLDPVAPPGPIVLAEPPPGHPVLAFDGLAPLVSLVAVRSVDEAVRRASAGPFALGAAVFGPEAAARAVTARLPARTVTINDLVVPTADPRLPFGGRGASGWGTTRGADGLRAMTVPVAVSARRRLRRRRAWAAPRPADAALFAAWLALAHGGPRRWPAGLAALARAAAGRLGTDHTEDRR